MIKANLGALKGPSWCQPVLLVLTNSGMLQIARIIRVRFLCFYFWQRFHIWQVIVPGKVLYWHEVIDSAQNTSAWASNACQSANSTSRELLAVIFGLNLAVSSVCFNFKRLLETKCTVRMLLPCCITYDIIIEKCIAETKCTVSMLF